ncbi:probable carbon monoxide dehydrogenase medium chain [Pseudooceanicola batsensis HTCC2597]|uniref:Probable carbon monoxide dehydrogenase medium chain n=1 Tax=Pseudooceanicola batsensis (strain ATCC BAA-863 / DSM 15984 / KCTC 12145 / HTCC2597) TaxID=252305 RepID=A3U0T8_PSEBH|nr:FAD binding domain-containing protein [Pseudooceanicola batsensis]EAQ02379.1 probable carbon monoxide dehydrogenase medium chain [Pseudooceanicola batsensis HTCC2597]
MKSPDFSYVRATSLDEALAMLADSEDAVILAGGQSLVAALNLRLQAPELVIDINHIPGLDRIELAEGKLRIGPLVRHAQLMASAEAARALPLIAQALPHVAHPAIRNRGTTCGSLAYGDPAAEMPACAVALDATLVLASRDGTREVPARDFYDGLYETRRAPHEMLIEARFPAAPEGARAMFAELAVRRGDFASLGLAGQLHLDAGAIAAFDLVAFASEPAPHLLTGVAELALGQRPDARLAADLAQAVAEAVDPLESPLATPAMRRRQYRALAERCLRDAMELADA